MNRKKWQIMPFDSDTVIQISEELDIDPHAVLLASVRGINDVYSAAEFFGLEPFDESSPLDIPDMDKAVKRIIEAIDNNEKICVYGDYDVDGVTATSVLYMYLKSINADVDYYIPDRHTEGYGLSKSAIDILKGRGIKLIVTVDNGISAVEEAKYAEILGIEIVITDHHLPGEILPDAVAVVDPHRNDCILDFRDFSGAGVAYKLICAIEGECNEKTESFIDLVALGTVADVMPLIDENRSFVKRGLYRILHNCRPGIMSLREAAGVADKEPTASELAFTVAPRINAAGRMGSAERGLKLLISDNIKTARDYAEDICDENISRQKAEQEITALAVEQINNNPSMLYDSVIVADGEGWNEGVIGIVASRLTEMYGKPSIVISRNGDCAKGSGRSIEGFSLYDALDAVKSDLTHFGGHTLAAGLGIESSNIEKFRKDINNYAEGFSMPFMIQRIDYKLKLHSINETLLDIAEIMEPCGAGNPQPVFGLFNMKIENISSIGSGKHIKLELSRNGQRVYAVKFSCTLEEFPYDTGDVIDIAASIKKNEYMNRVSVSVIIKNIRPHNINEETLLNDIRLFERFMRNGSITGEQAGYMLPDRNLNAAVYRFIRTKSGWNGGTEILCSKIGEQRYAPVMCSIEAMKQLGLIEESNGKITLSKSDVKVNFDDAPLIKKLKSFGGE